MKLFSIDVNGCNSGFGNDVNIQVTDQFSLQWNLQRAIAANLIALFECDMAVLFGFEYDFFILRNRDGLSDHNVILVAPPKNLTHAKIGKQSVTLKHRPPENEEVEDCSCQTSIGHTWRASLTLNFYLKN